MSKDLSDSANRSKLKKSDFALPVEEKYPIPDISHARNALARVAQNGSEAEQKKVRAAVEKRYPSLRKDEASGVWSYTEPDWEKLRAVVTGHGPASQDRLEFRRRSREHVEWVSRAVLADAA